VFGSFKSRVKTVVFFVGSAVLMIGFGAVVLSYFGKEKLNQQFYKFFDELF
jgi:hypothetical protein